MDNPGLEVVKTVKKCANGRQHRTQGIMRGAGRPEEVLQGPCRADYGGDGLRAYERVLAVKT